MKRKHGIAIVMTMLYLLTFLWGFNLPVTVRQKLGILLFLPFGIAAIATIAFDWSVGRRHFGIKKTIQSEILLIAALAVSWAICLCCSRETLSAVKGSCFWQILSTCQTYSLEAIFWLIVYSPAILICIGIVGWIIIYKRNKLPKKLN